jgi:hypothetical protein
MAVKLGTWKQKQSISKVSVFFWDTGYGPMIGAQQRVSFKCSFTYVRLALYSGNKCRNMPSYSAAMFLLNPKKLKRKMISVDLLLFTQFYTILVRYRLKWRTVMVSWKGNSLNLAHCSNCAQLLGGYFIRSGPVFRVRWWSSLFPLNSSRNDNINWS